MQSEIEQLRNQVSFLTEQLSLVGQNLAVLSAREAVNDCMFSALILTHPEREALRSEWRKGSARVIPQELVRGSSAYDVEYAETAKLRVEHLNGLSDE